MKSKLIKHLLDGVCVCARARWSTMLATKPSSSSENYLSIVLLSFANTKMPAQDTPSDKSQKTREKERRRKNNETLIALP